MSTNSLDKELQEQLREASAIGDIDEVRALVESGVNVNSQNEINGWWVFSPIYSSICSVATAAGQELSAVIVEQSYRD